ncbi:MAG: heavy metal translocating P-type ATPase [Proteiniphilum sp.]|jgi:Cu2+-exporting ATPase|nr:heavy metal translocating P-type ATPase [Proteiniphilum sp.]MDD2938342.1 heavy metal translocating P-type ATPase [Proteiniphilum sp.]MDD3779273.1 heavy metal translocating P-type ATPase [Proteiniphilum sp.]MDD3956668.1 heavy metal translocating P-type ATPase [Proteiniphilum sp.]MDD4453173.1 heavy metal translocating P-type ATPase [Proteiniphilum sp.]
MEHANANNDGKHVHDSHSHHEHEMHHHAMNEGHDMHSHTRVTHDHMNHTGHEGHDHAGGHLGHMSHMGNLKQKFWISLIITIPIILLSTFMGERLPLQFSFPGSDWVVLVLSSVLFFYGGTPFLKGAKMELKEKNPAMMTLISMGITVAYIYSVYAFISNHFFHAAGHRMDFFWELATLIVIMLLGHWIEMRAVGNAGNALKKMAELLPGSAHLVDEHGNITDVDLKQIQIGQLLIVNAGEKIPTDGKIVEGNTTVNESMVTGEAKAVKKAVGDQVIGGAVNGNGTIKIEVTGTGESGFLAQVMKLVSEAQQEKSRSETLSDKVARALFYVAVTAGIIAFVVWFLITKNVDIALERLVTVLIIACPHALGLAIPLVVARSTSLGASNGLLIRNRVALEKSKKIAVVTMDKTGTLTEGDFRVSVVESLSDKWSNDEVLLLMASLESHSNHPLAVGILEEAEKREIRFPAPENVTVISGTGLSGTVEDKQLLIVKPAYLDQKKLPYDKNRYQELALRGNSVSYLIVDNEVAGIVAQGDEIKEEAKNTVDGLKRMQITPVMLTGDNEGYAKNVAAQVNITEVHAELLPQDKERLIQSWQNNGKPVMMVGDGVNDAPALARAEIGVAIGAGTDVAIDSADVVLVKSNPSDILHFFSLAKNTTRKMVQNLWWGAGYNIIAIPLAAGVLAPVGIVLSPAVGAVLMSISTIVVALNSMTLKLE